MTEGKILAHRERKNEVLQSLNENAHRLRTLANGIDEQFNIDPEFANKTIGQISKGIGQVIGSIGAVAVGTIVAGPKGGIAAATGAIAPQMVSEAVNDAESTLGKSYMDMTEEEKEEVALATAAYTVVGTAFEFAPVARMPWVKNFLKGKTKVPAGVLKSPRIRREIAKGFAAEGFTEAAQGQLLDSLARATFDDDRELMSWDVLRQRFNEFFVGGVVGGTVSGGIATVQRTARGDLFKPKETKEVKVDGTTKEVFDITYTDRNTNEPVTIQIDAENQEDAARIAGERLVTSAVEGTIVARPKPAPEPVTQPEPGVTVEDEPTEAEQAELQEELQQELDLGDVTAQAAAVGLTPKEFTSRLKDTKVATDEGKPIEVYRGTRNIEFETKGRGRVPSFTSSPDIASTYSSTAGGGPFNMSLSFKEGASVSPVFLSMKKPLDFTEEDNFMSLGNYLAYMEYGNNKNGITKEEVDKLINYMVKRGRGKTKAKGNFIFRLDDSFTTPEGRPLDFSRDEYSDLNEFKDEYDSGLSLEDNIIQDGLYFDQFIAADAPVTKRVAERLGFDGIIHKDAFGLKEEYEQLTGKKVEGLTQERREDGLSIVEDDIHITYRPFSEEQVIGSLQQPDVTAEATPTEPTGPYSPSTLGEFITKDFTPIAEKIGTDIVADESVELAQYNASKGLIQYNPTALGQRDKQYVTAAMREELIHGAMSKVILERSKGKNEAEAFVSFMSDLGQSLTEEQRTAISQVYSGLETDFQYGTEYSRAAVQQALYGNVTESYISKGPAFDKIKRILKSVQSYLARTLGSEVDSNPEAAGVIRAAAELLQQADPSASLINQNIVQQAKAMSAPIYPNSDYGFAVQGEPFNERIEDVSTFKKYALTMNGLLADIDPALKRFSTRYYYSIESKSLDRLRASLPFVQKYRGIKKKSKKDFKRLKRLLLFSEASVTDQGQAFVQERDELLKKYGMYNDFQLGPRFVLDEILDEGTNAGVEIGKVYDYMPRFINDLEKVKNFYGKTTKTGFREYIKDQNARIKEARETMDKLQDEGKSVPADVRLLANKEIVKIGNKETAYFEAIYFDDYLSQQGFKKPKGTAPSSIKERTVGVRESELIPKKIIDAYDDIDVALERYIYNMTSSLETLRFIGRRYTYENNGIQINKNQVPSELSVLLRELVAANRITEEQATGIIPDIFQRATKVRKQEAAPAELLRSLGYISGLVEFTSTLSQLLDTTFVTVRNNPLTTISAILNTTVTGQKVGVDVEQIASEFVQDKTARTKSSRTARVADFSNKSLRFLLATTGFRQLDIRMKNANLTANFNRYRKLANEYYKNRDSKKSKLFISELTYLGLSPNEQIQFIAQLKKFKPGNPDAQQFRNAPLVRQVLFSRLQETQPLSKGSRPLAATENPNTQILYMMKSFMISQMNNARSEIINRIFDTRLSGLERRRAATDLLRLLAGLLAIGMPVAALKDFIAGRFGYFNDYLINSLLSPLGISTYTGYKIQREGIGGAAVSYFAPVSLQMAGDMLFIMQKLMNGQKVQPKDITAFAPYSEIINRVSGFNTEPQLRKFERKKKQGQRPIVIPSEIRVPQGIF